MSNPPSLSPTAPEVSILTSLSDLPGLASENWDYGVESRDQIGRVPSGTWPNCGQGPDDKLDVPEDLEIPHFNPFLIYATDGCKGRADLQEMTESARDTLAAAQAYELARELWTGATTENPSLQSRATDLGGPASPAVVAASALLANFEECTKGVATPHLHVPTLLIPVLDQAGFFTRSGNRFLTATGAVVIPGPGYPSLPGDWGPLANEEDPDSGAAAAAGQAWMYVTGPVQASLGDSHLVTSGNGPGFARLNKTYALIERKVIYRFSVNCVFAALGTVASL